MKSRDDTGVVGVEWTNNHSTCAIRALHETQQSDYRFYLGMKLRNMPYTLRLLHFPV